MILPSYLAFRHQFALVARSSGTLLVYDHVLNSITRFSGSFVTSGFAQGMSLDVIGTAANDARYTLSSVSTNTLTINEQLNDDESVVSSLVGAFYENDGAEQWPIDHLRINGFADTVTIPQPVTTLPLDITCNAGATDIADGTTYNWYVSQRSDEVARRYFVVTQPDPTKSGTIRLTFSTIATNELGLGILAGLNTSTRHRAFAKVYIYVQRMSDKAIQIVDLARASNAEA